METGMQFLYDPTFALAGNQSVNAAEGGKDLTWNGGDDTEHINAMLESQEMGVH